MAFFAIGTSSFARDTAPRLVYWVPFIATPVYVDTSEKAEALLIADWEGRYPQFKVIDFFTNSNTPVYNGVPSEHDFHYVVLATGEVWWSSGYLIQPECPKNMPRMIGAANSHDDRISCTVEIAYPETDCDVCNPKNPSPAVGKPISPSTGVEQLTETDYEGSGANNLSFTRTYRSDRNGWSNNYQSFGIDFSNPLTSNINRQSACLPSTGISSGLSYCFPYVGTGLANDFALQRSNGRILNFGSATDLLPAIDINDRVAKQFDANGATIGYQVYNSANENKETYDLTGRLQSIISPNGNVQYFSYSDSATATAIAPLSGLLIQVRDNFGYQIKLTYDALSRLSTMTDPTGGVYHYAYDEPSSIVISQNTQIGNLTSVTYPNGSKRIYWYNEQDKVAAVDQPYLLTGITDENDKRYASIHYDTSGRGVSTELANGVQKYTIAYSNSYASTVTDPLNTSHTYQYQSVVNVLRNTGISQPVLVGSGSTTTSIRYDDSGNVASVTDLNGTKTTYAYDLTRNLETSRVEAAGTPQARTTTTTWHATYRLPLQIAEPKRITTFAYDTSGNLLSKTVQATTDVNGSQGLGATLTGKARVRSYTYNSFGQVLTATGPRTDVNDTMSYSYDSSGNLTTVVNAAGHITSLSNYDANGRVGTIKAPNGDITNQTYTARGWLSSKTVVANGVSQTTTYDHDGVGQLIKVTLPDASYVAYTYDDAHRLTDISDGLGNSIAYTLDLQGNRISEASKDATGALARQVSRVYDSLNNLQQQTGGVQ
jgi:YD repeat-containing protein